MIFKLIIVITIFCICIIHTIQLNIPFRPLIPISQSSSQSYNQQITPSSSLQQPGVEQILPDNDQKEAILSTNRATLVVAGPGSGKTRVLSSRLAYLLLSAEVTPDKILVISFTNSAANNLRTKADELLLGTVATTNDVTCNTFHGFCISVMRQYSELIFPLQNKGFTIVEENDQKKLMLSILESQGMPLSQSSISNILRQIREWKELGLGYQGIRPQIHLETDTQRKAYKLYPSYQSKLKSLSALDFGDLLLLTISLFRQFPHVLQYYRQKFSHILIDEFQDISPAQYDILRMLVMGGLSVDTGGKEVGEWNSPGMVELDISSPQRRIGDSGKGVQVSNNNVIQSGIPLNGKELGDYSSNRYNSNKYDQENIVVNVFAAGDDDQSIYGTRGARSDLMKRFRFDFPDSKLMRFHVSYRLPETMYKAAEVIVSKLPDRITKTLHKKALLDIFETGEYEDYEDSSINDSGANIEIRKMITDKDEVDWILSYLESKLASKSLMNRSESIAILARTQQDVRLLAESLNSKKIPFRSIGSGSWVLPREGSSPLNLLRLIASPDDNMAFQAALDNDLILANVDQNDIKNIIIPTIRKYAEQKQLSLIQAARGCVLTKQLKGNNQIAIERFILKFAAWKSDQDRYFRKGEAAERITYAILQSAYTLRWGPEIASVVKDLSRQVSSFNNLQEFFSALRLDGDFIIEDTASSKNMYTNTNKIKSESSEDYAGPSATIWVMTMHAAKGLEFDEVVLPFWNEGNVPKNNSPEERRLAFVSLTRARNKVLISNAKTRAVTKQILKPSALITELLDLKYSHISFEEVQSRIDNRIEQPPRYDYQSTVGAELKERPPSLSKSVALNRPTKNSLSSPLSTSQLTQSIPTPPVTSSLPSATNSFSSPSPPSLMHHPYSREGDLRTALFDQVGTPINSISKVIGRYNDLNKSHDIITPPSTLEQEKARKGKQKSASNNDDDNKVKKATNKSSKQTTTTTRKTKTTTSSTSKLTTTELTDINNLTSTDVNNLLTTKSVTKQILKLYFKEVLRTRFGIKRGSISINNDTNKVISKCTVEELGQYLYSMIKKDEQ